MKWEDIIHHHYRGVVSEGKAVLVTQGIRDTNHMSSYLVSESAWFECNPFPDDFWHFTVKIDRYASVCKDHGLEPQ